MKQILLLVVFLVAIALVFFYPVFLYQKLPIPADTIVGLYHPYRDLYAKDYPNGIPFKNSLITDPVRQQYPWRMLAISSLKQGELPLWNAYTFSGTPLLANLQNAALYPLNLIFLVLPFSYGWTLLVMLEPLLAALFLYLYLRNLKLTKCASLFGSISFAFCGFMTAWIEWGTLGHVALWLPLVLLSIDKLESGIKNHESKDKNKRTLIWSLVYIFSLTASFLAGHLQIFFYVFLLSFFYFLSRWWQNKRSLRILSLFIIQNSLFLLLSAIQWNSTYQFILQSARQIDQSNWLKNDWFLPWQHLLQFVVPDFFGNPTTLNYWGVWNYGEFVGYIGMLPLIFVLFAVFFRRDKKTYFFLITAVVSLLFALPTFIAKIPYAMQVPFIASSQPSRLMVLINFSLCILAALGFDYFIRKRTKKIIFAVLIVAFFVIIAWGLLLFYSPFKDTANDFISASKRNLSYSTLLFVVSSILTFGLLFFKQKKMSVIVTVICIVFLFGDLFRFFTKFDTFSDQKYLYPKTRITEFLEKNTGNYRVMALNDEILPPNFTIMHHIQTISGYDPLYMKNYGDFVASIEKNEATESTGFNRILTPKNISSPLVNLLGVKYILSFDELTAPNLKKVFEEGRTNVYENKGVFPRAFFVNSTINTITSSDALHILLSKSYNPRISAVVEGLTKTIQSAGGGKVRIVSYNDNNVVLETSTNDESFLVLTDTYYSTWHAKMRDTSGGLGIEVPIFRTNSIFRGVVVPRGSHFVEFYNTIL